MINTKKTLLLTVISFLCHQESVRAQRRIVCPRVQSTDWNMTLQVSDPWKVDFTEISGLGYSPTLVGPSGKPLIYVVNDGGGGRRFGIYDSGTGVRLKSLRLPRSFGLALDFESISVGSCGVDEELSSCIYIADVGDNVARDTDGTRTQHSDREATPIYKIREPNLNDFQDNAILPEWYVTRLNINYLHPTSPTPYADSEATFVDSVGWGEGGAPGDFYIVTKWGTHVNKIRLFKIPAHVWKQAEEDSNFIYSPEAVGDYSNGRNSNAVTQRVWTRAEMTLDGTIIAMGTYNDQYLFLRCPGMSVTEALAVKGTQPCESWPIAYWDSQFETIAWGPDGTWTLEISECSWSSCNPNVPMVFTTMNYTYDPERASCPGLLPTGAPTSSPSLMPSVSPAPTPYCPSVLRSTESLYSDKEPKFLCSPNGMYRFGLGENGDLSLWNGESKVWSAETCCNATGVFLNMQNDANLVLRGKVGDEEKKAIWVSNTANSDFRGAELSLDNDGQARIRFNRNEIWSTPPSNGTYKDLSRSSCYTFRDKESCQEVGCRWKGSACIANNRTRTTDT